jgi:hypothetical protein
MLIEAARRAEAAAREILSLVNEGSASCAEMREMLTMSKATVSIMVAAQTSAAAIIAGSERHGDGGAQILADGAGMTRHDAKGQIKTARVIEAAPVVRDAVESGRVSQANAKRLAEAIEKTGAEVVESDPDLLTKAESMRPEQFAREARRWTADRQHDGGEGHYQRLRARRRVRVWDGDDGMLHLHGEFDPVTGQQVASRLRAEARRLHDTDKRHAADGIQTQRRSFDQCMADALDHLTNTAATATGASSGSSPGGGKPFADICVVAHVDDDTGELIAELPDGERLPNAVLEQLSCNARLTGVVYDRCGKPIWRTQSRRTVTEAQWQLLIAKWGGCFHCGANPGICQGHHIEPASRGGPTRLDNLVPACWTCHHRIHHDDWWIHKRPDGYHTLHPPDRVSHGPAHAPDADYPPPTPGPDTGHPGHGATRRAPNRPETPQPDPGILAPTGPDDPAGPTEGPGPAAARAALRHARANRDGPGKATTRDPSPQDRSLSEDRPHHPRNEPLVTL